MIRSLNNIQVSFDVPAPVLVCAVLLVGALTKCGHSEWAIAGSVVLYALYAAIQYSKQGARHPRQQVAADCP